MRRASLLLLTTLISLHASFAHADVVTLKDGTTATGKVLKQTPGKSVTIKTNDGVETIPWDEIKRVSVDEGNSSSETSVTPTTPDVSTQKPSEQNASGAKDDTSNAGSTLPKAEETKEEKTKSSPTVPLRFDLGVRAAYAVPAGSVTDSVKTSDAYSSMIPFTIDALFGFTPHLYAGVFGQYGILNLKSGGSACRIAATDCSGHDIRLGVEAAYHFLPGESFDPWIGAGFGYEWASTSATVNGNGGSGPVPTTLSETAKGWEYLNLQAGVDYDLGRSFALGLFAMTSFGKLSTYSSSTSGASSTSSSGDIANAALHEWISFGVRGRYLVGP